MGNPERQGEHPDRRSESPSWSNDPPARTGGSRPGARRRRPMAERRHLRHRHQHDRHRRHPAPWNTWARTAPGRRPAQLGQPVHLPGRPYVDAAARRAQATSTRPRRLGLLGQQRSSSSSTKDPKTGSWSRPAYMPPTATASSSSPDREKLAARADYPNKPTALINAWPFVDGITWAKGFPCHRQADPRPATAATCADGCGRATRVPVRPFLGGKNWNPMAYSPTPACSTSPPTTGRWTTGPRNCSTRPAPLPRPGLPHQAPVQRPRRHAARHGSSPARSSGAQGDLPAHRLAPSPPAAAWCSPAPGRLRGFRQPQREGALEVQTGSGIISSPITWEMDGEQYIAIQSGYGGAVPLWAATWPRADAPGDPGGSVWVSSCPSRLPSAEFSTT